jgi:hypothetical protein
MKGPPFVILADPPKSYGRVIAAAWFAAGFTIGLLAAILLAPLLVLPAKQALCPVQRIRRINNNNLLRWPNHYPPKPWACPATTAQL